MASASSSLKDVTAMKVNLKESRILNKAVQTLSLEEAYSCKLLSLDEKIIRFQYSRLTNNVSKIKSCLRPDEIVAMKTLESEGKFKPVHASICSSSSAGKIAAARRRLKLDYHRRAVSAHPRLTHSQPEENTTQSENQNVSAVDAQPSILCSKLRPHTTANSLRKNSLSVGFKLTPNQSYEPQTSKSVLEKITTARKANKLSTPKTLYSCHDDKVRSSKTERASRSNKNVLEVFGPNPYEERRKRLIVVEGKALQDMTEKKTEFIERVEEFVEANPSIVDIRPEATEEIIQSIDSMAARPGSNLDIRSAKLASNCVESALLRQFAEIRKTRYLRVDESLIDNSGVRTLAKDLFKGTENWRRLEGNKPRVSFRAAATL